VVCAKTALEVTSRAMPNNVCRMDMDASRYQ
jgi:hypothetical protein